MGAGHFTILSFLDSLYLGWHVWFLLFSVRVSRSILHVYLGLVPFSFSIKELFTDKKQVFTKHLPVFTSIYSRTRWLHYGIFSTLLAGSCKWYYGLLLKNFLILVGLENPKCLVYCINPQKEFRDFQLINLVGSIYKLVQKCWLTG